MGSEGGRLKAGCRQGSFVPIFQLLPLRFPGSDGTCLRGRDSCGCLPVRLHTCARTPTTYLYLPECTPLHFHSLPPCICSLPHHSTSVIAHTGFAHRPWSLSRVGPQNRYVCGVRQLAGPLAQGRAGGGPPRTPGSACHPVVGVRAHASSDLCPLPAFLPQWSLPHSPKRAS